MFSTSAIKQIAQRGSDLGTVEQQIKNFQTGFPYLAIHRSATIGDGIIQLSDSQLIAYSELYEKLSLTKKIIKFVPASGAATRMFKELFTFLSDENFTGNKAVQTFIAGISKFAFYAQLNEVLTEKGTSLDDELTAKNYLPIVSALLEESGLGYGTLPKALLLFHQYSTASRTPLEEHLVEGAKYAKGSGLINLHFTVSPEHLSKFKTLVNSVVKIYEKEFGTTYSITFSQQKAETDTIAVDLDNKAFIEDDDSLLFRPAGHGALLSNLNDLDGDLIFIKNIDNVLPDRLKESTITYKKALAGLLLQTQATLHKALSDLDNNVNTSQIANMTKDQFGIDLGSDFAEKNSNERLSLLKKKLNRPVRICGMVKNTGEPGGGPFWVKNTDGTESLQIAETAQIDMNDAQKSAILMSSTHFNPVDLVCATKDYKGNKFDLLQYRDDSTGFISEKSKSGRDLKAQELPGLWNGAMADWITLFVEVPIDTFSPVKTVNDLLKDMHQ